MKVQFFKNLCFVTVCRGVQTHLPRIHLCICT